MGEPRMARVDVSILVREKGAKVKRGKYLYIIASKDFPKGLGNPISGSAYVENTTVNRMALQCLVDALQRIHRPSMVTIHTTSVMIASMAACSSTPKNDQGGRSAQSR